MESSSSKSCETGTAVRRMVSGGHHVIDQPEKNNTFTGRGEADSSFVSDGNSPGAASKSAGTASGGNEKLRSEQGEEDAGVIAAPASLNTSSFQSGGEPAEIPPEPSSEGAGEENEEEEVDDDRQDGEEGDEESEYEYEDDEDAAFSGFLVDHAPLAPLAAAQQSSNESQGNPTYSPARIRDEEESDSQNAKASSSAVPEPRKAKWREPSREAVSMSLRAEREKTGSKRRLAQDLYRIMNQDTEEAGFSIAPKSEDNMDHWIIKLFMFDPDSNLAKDMLVLGFEHIELEMTFPDQYPFEPPFVRVVRPRFKRQTGFVMNGALCMELLTKDGWNPVNDIESVIVSIRSLLVVGDGRLQAAYEMPDPKYQARLKASKKGEEDSSRKRQKKEENPNNEDENQKSFPGDADGGSYTVAEAHAAYSHLSDYHKKKGWDSSGWWARKG